MLEKLLKPLTTARASGVVFRDAVIAVGAIISLLGIIGVLTPQQVIELQRTVDTISGQWPQIALAVGALMAAGMSVYRALYKSSSDKAAEVAARVDAEVPKDDMVVVKTPPGEPDIVVHPK